MWLHYDVISTQRRHHSSKASILFMQKNREELTVRNQDHSQPILTFCTNKWHSI